MGEIPHQEITVGRLVSAANQENWKLVDTALEATPNNDEFISWATTNVGIRDYKLRDLAASIFEKAPKEIGVPPDMIERLHKFMGDMAEDPKYLSARFRFASALFKHERPSAEAESVIREAANNKEDPKLAEAAAKRLSEIEDWKNQEAEGANPEA